MPRTKQPLEEMTYVQLAEIAKARGVPHSGPKAKLLARLQGQSPSATRSGAPTSATEYAKLFRQFTSRVTKQGGSVVVAFDDKASPKEAVALISLR